MSGDYQLGGPNPSPCAVEGCGKPAAHYDRYRAPHVWCSGHVPSRRSVCEARVDVAHRCAGPALLWADRSGDLRRLCSRAAAKAAEALRPVVAGLVPVVPSGVIERDADGLPARMYL